MEDITIGFVLFASIAFFWTTLTTVKIDLGEMLEKQTELLNQIMSETQAIKCAIKRTETQEDDD